MTRVLDSIGRSKVFWRRESGPGRLLERREGRSSAHRAQRDPARSTLLNLIAGVESPTKGANHLGRTTDRPLAAHRIVGQGIAKTHQTPERS